MMDFTQLPRRELLSRLRDALIAWHHTLDRSMRRVVAMAGIDHSGYWNVLSAAPQPDPGLDFFVRLLRVEEKFPGFFSPNVLLLLRAARDDYIDNRDEFDPDTGDRDSDDPDESEGGPQCVQ